MKKKILIIISFLTVIGLGIIGLYAASPKEKTAVLSGPGSNYVTIGSVDTTDTNVSVYNTENGYFRISYEVTGSGGMRKMGYVPVGSMNNEYYFQYLTDVKYTKVSATALKACDVYYGYAPSENKFLKLGSVSSGETVQFLASEEGYSYIEYKVTSGADNGKLKRGYAPDNMIKLGSSAGSTALSTKTGIACMSGPSDVYAGPRSDYAKIGSVGTEAVTVIEKEDDWFYIEYWTKSNSVPKRGYIPKEKIPTYATVEKNAKSANLSGYDDATNKEVTVLTGPDAKYASLGTIFNGEWMTVLNKAENDYTMVEYSTSGGPKRGFIPNGTIAGKKQGIMTHMLSQTKVFDGPDTSYASIGTVFKNELVVALETDKDLLYVEYNTSKGRKRGYVEKQNLQNIDKIYAQLPKMDYSSSSLYYTTSQINVVSGPNKNYASVGTVFSNERIMAFQKAENDYTFIEYSTPDGTKRGYIGSTLMTKALDVKIPSLSGSGIKAVKYGTSGKGKDLTAYKVTDSSSKENKVAVAVFEVHGFEDAWYRDGDELVQIGSYLVNNMKDYGLQGWTLYVIPAANPDGLIEGWSNNGPGRCTVANGVDINRSFPVGFVAQYNKRNFTGSTPLGAPEAKSLRDFVAGLKEKDPNEMVLFDLHGFMNETLGNSDVSKYFRDELGISKHDNTYGAGYLTSWSNSIGIKSALIEYPMPKNTADISYRQYSQKTLSAFAKMFKSNPDNSAPTPVKTADELYKEEIAREVERVYNDKFCDVTFKRLYGKNSTDLTKKPVVKLDLFKEYLKVNPWLFEKYRSKVYSQEYYQLVKEANTFGSFGFHGVDLEQEKNFYAGTDFYNDIVYKESGLDDFINIMGPYWDYCHMRYTKGIKGIGFQITGSADWNSTFGATSGFELIWFFKDGGLEKAASEYSPHLYFFSDGHKTVDIETVKKSYFNNQLYSLGKIRDYNLKDFIKPSPSGAISPFIVAGDSRFVNLTNYTGFFNGYSLTVPVRGFPVLFSMACSDDDSIGTYGLGTTTNGSLGISNSRSYYTYLFDSTFKDNRVDQNLIGEQKRLLYKLKDILGFTDR